jgi:hypothetical protein
MKKRNYLKVSYKQNGVKCSQDFIMSETRFINTVVKKLADNNKCDVELIECTQKEYDLLF